MLKKIQLDFDFVELNRAQGADAGGRRCVAAGAGEGVARSPSRIETREIVTMNEPWFDANSYAWIPGTLLGVLAGLWGSLLGVLAPRGKAKSLLLGSLGFMLAASAVCLILGVLALVYHQPYGVWYGLILPGFIGLVVLGSLTPVAIMSYRQADLRKMQARDL
jgi:hypothetical protein